MAKSTLQIKKNKKGVQLHVQGNLNVQHANDLKKFFLQSISRSSNEMLILNQVTAFDVASIQLTHLWKMSLKKQGRTASIELPESESLKDLLEKTGITNIL